MQKTKIDWADCTLNPVVGCTYGCPFCYARRLNNRFGYVKDFSCPVFFPERLKQLESKKPKTIFMDSMSDVADWKIAWMQEIFKAAYRNPQHTYLFLTKRPEKYNGIINFLETGNISYDDEPPAIWLGASVTKGIDLYPAWDSAATWINIEPILEEIDTEEIFMSENPVTAQQYGRWGWVVIGAETGNRKGKITPNREWIAAIVNECRNWRTPVFMKNSLRSIWDEPLIQEFPW